MSIESTSSVDDNLIDALVSRLRAHSPLIAECDPKRWDSDDEAIAPNLRANASGRALIPSQPVYEFSVAITWDSKPKRTSLRALKKDVEAFCEDTALGASLSDGFLSIETNAEDIQFTNEVIGGVREYGYKFQLRGFRRQ